MQDLVASSGDVAVKAKVLLFSELTYLSPDSDQLAI